MFLLGYGPLVEGGEGSRSHPESAEELKCLPARESLAAKGK